MLSIGQRESTMHPNANPLLIAEIGSVHDGSFGNALKLIELAADVGADAVKFQTHIASSESLRDAPGPSYFSDEPRYEYFERTAFHQDQWIALSKRAEEIGILFLSSPFSIEAVDLLEEVGIAAYKVASGEVSNIPMLERIADTGKPSFLSSGMSNWAELDRAVEVLSRGGPVTVMQCSSRYPCRPEEAGLNVLSEMRARYELPVGFSDHTSGIGVAIAAAAMGASAIEKHLTFSRAMYGSDARFAAEAQEFELLARSLREVWSSLAHDVDKDETAPYRDMKHVFEKSIVAVHDLPAGTVLKRADLAFKKPGDGIPAAQYQTVIGRELARSVAADHKLGEEDFR